MPLEPAPVYTVNYLFQDNNNKTSSVGIAFNGSILYTDVLTAAATLADRMVALSDAVLVSYSVSRLIRETGPISPPASSEVERKLRVPLNAGQFRNASSLEVPSPIFGIEVNGTDVVNVGNPAVAALLSAVVNEGGILGSAQIATYYGEDVTSAGVPFITHRNRKRT